MRRRDAVLFSGTFPNLYWKRRILPNSKLPRLKEVIVERHLHSQQFTPRMLDWPADVIGSCVAGVSFLVLELLAM